MYEKQLAVKDVKETDPVMRKAITKLESLEYELSFDDDYALFRKVEGLDTEANPLVEAFTNSLSGFSGEIYFQKNDKKVIHKKEFSGKIYLINKAEINWKLINEKKPIGGFICYKATTVDYIENSSGTQKINITAWYAPEIALPFGPDGFGGLPGLILQLENNGTITKVKKFDFVDDDKTIAIDSPTKGTIVTEKEFNELVSNAWANRNN